MRMRGLGVLFMITTVVSWCVHTVLRLMLSECSMGAGRAPGCGVQMYKKAVHTLTVMRTTLRLQLLAATNLAF